MCRSMAASEQAQAGMDADIVEESVTLVNEG